jgi:hypothetical protein
MLNSIGYSLTEDIMGAVVAVVKPLLIQIATHPAVKNLVVELLSKYVKSTDNSIDDVVLELVKEKLFTPQA